MKTKLTLATMAIAVIVIGGLLSISSAPKPQIVFAGFRDNEGRKLAVFTMTNSSKVTFSFTGYATNSPVYLTAWTSNAVWVAQDPFWCGTGLRTRALPPHSSCGFEVPVPEEAKGVFAVGICFEPGKPEEVERRYNNRIARTVRWLRGIVRWYGSEHPNDRYTWSPEVRI